MGEAVVIGAGPAGLMAAETLARAGHAVTVHERMPSPARKFLMAGRGGLNLTHSEPLSAFLERYDRPGRLEPLIEAFPPEALRDWVHGLGQPTFTGSSGRIFPEAMKASPLLRAWLARLEDLGVRIVTRSEWRGWAADGGWRFLTGGEEQTERPDAVVLALGGASWPRLGSAGDWAARLSERGVTVEPLRPSNMGVNVAWNPIFIERFAGQALKGVVIQAAGRRARGDLMIAVYGLEGGPIYALSDRLRDLLHERDETIVTIDLKPDVDAAVLAHRLARPRGSESLSNFLRKAAGLSPAALGLLREAGPPPLDAEILARRIKAVPVALTGTQGLERAISSAGGLDWEALDERLMIRAMPGVFAAGEMLDWSAPTGGYLLQACFASGHAAAQGAVRWMDRPTG